MNYLCGLANTSSPGRALNDFAVGEAALLGVNHAKISSIYVAVRANGPNAGAITTTLLVNGTVALLGGVPVTAMSVAPANGGVLFLTPTPQAPSPRPDTPPVAITPRRQTHYYPPDDPLPVAPLNQATHFASGT